MPCNSSGPEALTRQFYEWEKRGRGWQVFDQPVAPEPPFRPFYGHFIPGNPGAGIDDARKPTFFTNLVDGFFKGRSAAPETVIFQEEAEPAPLYIEEAVPL